MKSNFLLVACIILRSTFVASLHFIYFTMKWAILWYFFSISQGFSYLYKILCGVQNSQITLGGINDSCSLAIIGILSIRARSLKWIPLLTLFVLSFSSQVYHQHQLNQLPPFNFHCFNFTHITALHHY